MLPLTISNEVRLESIPEVDDYLASRQGPCRDNVIMINDLRAAAARKLSTMVQKKCILILVRKYA